jgi:hypothetical protein
LINYFCHFGWTVLMMYLLTSCYPPFLPVSASL